MNNTIATTTGIPLTSNFANEHYILQWKLNRLHRIFFNEALSYIPLCGLKD